MSVLTSHDPKFLELLRELGAPENLTSFELRAGVNEIVTARCEYYQRPTFDGERVKTLVQHFELVGREDLAQLRRIRKALAALDETARALQADGGGFIAIGRMQDVFREEIRAARKAERLPE